MFSEGLAVFVEELSVGSFQSPSEFGRISLAGVDLVALSMDLKQ